MRKPMTLVAAIVLGGLALSGTAGAHDATARPAEDFPDTYFEYADFYTEDACVARGRLGVQQREWKAWFCEQADVVADWRLYTKG